MLCPLIPMAVVMSAGLVLSETKRDKGGENL